MSVETVYVVIPETFQQIILGVFILIVIAQYFLDRKGRKARNEEVRRLKEINDYLEKEVIAKMDNEDGAR